MKKIIAFLLVLIMALTLCACHKNEDPTLQPEYKDGQKTSSGLDLSAFEGRLLKPYIELIDSGNYYYRIVSDDQIEVFTQIGKEKMVSIKTATEEYVLIQDASGTLFLVAGDGYVELNENLSPYVSAEQIAAFKALFVSSNKIATDLVTLTYSDKGQSLSIPGTTNLKHEEYVDNYGVVFSFFFDGSNNNSLVMLARIESKDKYSLTNIEFGEPSPNSISNILLNYRKIDPSELAAQMQGQGVTPTEAPTTTQAPTTTTTKAPTTTTTKAPATSTTKAAD